MTRTDEERAAEAIRILRILRDREDEPGHKGYLIGTIERIESGEQVTEEWLEGLRRAVAEGDASAEIVIYVPTGRHSATAGIARGSAIVGLPEPGSEEVRVYFEGAIFGQSNMVTLADRAVHASGRLRERYPTVAVRMVPREALAAVGTFEEDSGRILLTGEQSSTAVAGWLGLPTLDPAELRPSVPRRVDTAELAARLSPGIPLAVNRGLATRLIERAGIRRQGGDWVAADGRRTSALAEALNWALVLIAADGT
jgi:hypothetical protein